MEPGNSFQTVEIMKRYLVILMSAVLAVVTSGCTAVDLAGISDVVYLDIPADCSKIEVNSCLEVRLSQECTAPQLDADVNVIPYVKVYGKRNTLIIELEKGFRLDSDGWNAFKAVVTLPARDLESVSLSGASVFSTDIPLQGRKFSLSASGASRFTGSVEAEELDISLSGASMMESGFLECRQMNLTASGASLMKASGTAYACSMNLTGASAVSGITDMHSYSLEIDHCRGELSGGSLAAFRSNGSISCTLSGASTIYYIGNADISGCRTSGASAVVREKNW